VGTGSGAIALSLAREGSFARIVATDVSQDALDVARDNAQANSLSDVVEFRCGALFEPLSNGERFGVIVSNPPYVAETDRDTLAPEVREYEPATALFAGADGWNVIDSLIAQAPQWLEPGGLLALELGLGQGNAALARIATNSAYANARVVADLTRRPRVLLAERAR
jgi:release factor glutamine methyltransferase